MSDFALTDDDVLRYTQGTRKKLIDEITNKGMPEGKDERIILLAALSDMDKVALGNKRIGAAEKLSESDKLVAKTIIEIGKKFGTVNPFENNEGDILEGIYEREVDLDLLPPPNTVPGETDVGITDLKYDEFVDMMEKD